MLLLLARHGNTFSAGDKVVWVGARTDLPLTAEGRNQAVALGEALTPIRSRVAQVISGPLRRTREHADIACEALGFEGSIDIEERLREIDYGLWEGKSSEEITRTCGDTELKAWNAHGVWPRSAGWTPSERDIERHIEEIVIDLRMVHGESEAALLVTSNGILKFFLKLIPGAFEDMARLGVLKVATGNCCALESSDAGWHVVFWNCKPAELRL